MRFPESLNSGSYCPGSSSVSETLGLVCCLVPCRFRPGDVGEQEVKENPDNSLGLKMDRGNVPG